MADRHSEMKKSLLHRVAKQTYEANAKGDIFRHTLYPSSLDAIGFIFSELRMGPAPSFCEDQQNPSLHRVNFYRILINVFDYSLILLISLMSPIRYTVNFRLADTSLLRTPR